MTLASAILSHAPLEIGEQEYSQISDMVRAHCGIHLHGGKKELVRARLAGPVRAGGFDGISDYLRHVMADRSGRHFTQMIDALSTNLTGFFREPRHFEFLSRQLLPTLIERKRSAGQRRIRAWSAGCSSGEEPYSLAMTLLGALGPDLRDWDVKILATDISTRALSTGEAGLYPREKLSDVPPAYLKSSVLKQQPGGEMRCAIAPAVRELVSFRRLNLMANWPFRGSFDFIFCRNVMIYFDRPTQERLVSRFWEQLVPGGYLFTGHAESLTGIEHRLRYVEPTIYCK